MALWRGSDVRGGGQERGRPRVRRAGGVSRAQTRKDEKEEGGSLDKESVSDRSLQEKGPGQEDRLKKASRDLVLGVRALF